MSSAFVNWELIIAIVFHVNEVEFVQIRSENVCARTVVPALIIFHFSTLGFFQRHERGWDLKGKVWKPSLSLTFISYSKQMRESIRDESKSLVLSPPLRVRRVINLYWRRKANTAMDTPDLPSHHLRFFGSKGCLLFPPLTPLSDVSCLRARWVIEIKGLLLGAKRYLYEWGLSSSHTLVLLASGAVKAECINFRRPECQTFCQNNYLNSFPENMKHLCQNTATVQSAAGGDTCIYCGSHNKTWSFLLFGIDINVRS